MHRIFPLLPQATLLCCMVAATSCVPAVVGVATGTAATVGSDNRSVGAFVEDESIELKIQNVLQADPEISEDRHINATSYNGIVLLTGEVPSEQQLRLVADKASSVNKVRKVHNHLQIGQATNIVARGKDTGITTAIKARMLAHKELSSLRIKVVTEAETVYLMGLVVSAQADAATEIARTTRGVTKVVRLFEITSN